MLLRETNMRAQNQVYLFVYGTLRKAVQHPMHQILDRHASFVGSGVFQGRLYNLESYPVAIRSADRSARVIGELYRVSQNKKVLKRLDDYEGSLFRRERVSITLENGATVRAWIYLFLGPTEGQIKIPSGDYVVFLRKR